MKDSLNDLYHKSNSDKITSNLDYINEVMNDLQKKIAVANEFSKKNHTLTSSKEGNKLYLSMNDVMSNYFKAQTELLNNLNHEAEFIKHIGEEYSKLDARLKDGADKL